MATTQALVDKIVKRIAVLNDIEDSLQALDGVPRRVNQIHQQVQQLNAQQGNADAATAQKQVVLPKRDTIQQESAANVASNWAKHLF